SGRRAGSADDELRRRDPRYRETALREVERLREVPGLRVALRKRREPEPPLEQLEHRGVVVPAVGDVPAARERRDEEARDPEPALLVLRLHVLRGRRRDVVEEAAPFVE